MFAGVRQQFFERQASTAVLKKESAVHTSTHMQTSRAPGRQAERGEIEGPVAPRVLKIHGPVVIFILGYVSL